MAHEDEVAFIMGEVAARALNPLPPARDVHARALAHLAAADQVTRPHGEIPGGRLSPVRRSLVSLLEALFERQELFNREVVRALREVETLTTITEERVRVGWTNLDHRIGGTQGEFARLQAEQLDTARSIQSSVTAVDVRMNDVEGAVADAEHREERLRDRVEDMAAALEAQRAEVAMLRTQVARLLARSAGDGEREATRNVAGAAHRDPRALDAMYVAFENEFRGPRDEVMRRHEVYLDDVAGVDGDGPVVDVGPGRGEWLELLGRNGIRGYGVDINPAIAKVAADHGVEVRIGDAVDHLEHVGEGKLRGVTAFHVVEHLDLEALLALIDAALVALQPRGVLILETPNPTNLVVGACGFYLDPTHLRPLHPNLLEFLVRHRGFTDVLTRYMHPVREVAGSPDARSVLETEIAWSLLGPQDYAIVATKPGP